MVLISLPVLAVVAHHALRAGTTHDVPVRRCDCGTSRRTRSVEHVARGEMPQERQHIDLASLVRPEYPDDAPLVPVTGGPPTFRIHEPVLVREARQAARYVER